MLVLMEEEVKRVFEMFDKNGDGRITRLELKESLEKLGMSVSDKDLAEMINKMDINGDGCIDIDEFRSLYQSILASTTITTTTMAKEEREEELFSSMMEAFKVFDRNGDGYISAEELKTVLGSLGLKQGRNAEDCRRMIMKADLDGDGMVNFNEFKHMMAASAWI